SGYLSYNIHTLNHDFGLLNDQFTRLQEAGDSRNLAGGDKEWKKWQWIVWMTLNPGELNRKVRTATVAAAKKRKPLWIRRKSCRILDDQVHCFATIGNPVPQRLRCH